MYMTATSIHCACCMFLCTCRPVSQNIFLPLQENVGYQSGPAMMHNPAYSAGEDIHTYDYIPADSMILTEGNECPPKLPPDRKVQVQGANDTGKGQFSSLYFS